jgi:hypothetical protein
MKCGEMSGLWLETPGECVIDRFGMIYVGFLNSQAILEVEEYLDRQDGKYWQKGLLRRAEMC